MGNVTPTVVALRAKAATVVDAELSRLAGRLTDEGVSGHALEEIAQTVRRVVDKLLHAPTVRVKELASSPDGEEYAAALRVLFDLDPRTVDAVTHAEVESPNLTTSLLYADADGSFDPGEKARMKQARAYEPDSICGTWERFGKIIDDPGGNKVAWAEAMGFL